MNSARPLLRVKVRYIGSFRYVTGKEDEIIQVKGNTIKDVIEKLAEQYGSRFLQEILDIQTGELLSTFLFLLNGKSVSSLGGLNARVKNEDSVAFVAMVGGG